MTYQFGHELMPQATHDEQALEDYLVSMRTYMFQQMDPIDRKLCNDVIAQEIEGLTGKKPTKSAEVRPALEAHPYHRMWLNFQRLYQDMIYAAIGVSVDRQYEDLDQKAQAISNPKGTLELDSSFEVPRYISSFDHHRMPGSYHTETRPNDIRAGAIYDRFSTTYHSDRNGGWRNDGRGHTLASHVLSLYPGIAVKRVLDMGCAVGHSTIALKQDFPDSEVHAIDVGAPMLRYAHARAESLGEEIHFSQQNAEHTKFPDEHFDLVVSAVSLHETSAKAMRSIFEECYRLLKPGGVMAHLETPARYDSMGLWEQVRVDFEAHYNNEPFMAGIGNANFREITEQAGFNPPSIHVGFRKGTATLNAEHKDFIDAAETVQGLMLGSWYICSAQK